MLLKKRLAALAAFVAYLVGTTAAFAEDNAHLAYDWQLGLQKAGSPVMARMAEFHDLLTVIIVAIALFVLALMIYVTVRFSAAKNPTPSRTVHNTPLEILWTVVPILILVFIAIPSFKLLYFQDRTHEAGMTLKVIGHQWYWSYEYPDHDGIAFDSNMVPDEELAEGQPRLLAVDKEVVLPVGVNVRLLFATDAEGVIHSWAVPSLGVKMDTVPGRLNETWVRIDEPGVYYGQCSELCGINHGFMPVAVRAVAQKDFDQWVQKAKTAMNTPAASDLRIAQNETRQ